MLSITDDGIGIPEQAVPRVLEPGSGKGHGIALRNVHDRLRGSFGPGSGVSVCSAPGTATTVSLVIRPPHASAHGMEPSGQAILPDAIPRRKAGPAGARADRRSDDTPRSAQAHTGTRDTGDPVCDVEDPAYDAEDSARDTEDPVSDGGRPS